MTNNRSYYWLCVLSAALLILTATSSELYATDYDWIDADGGMFGYDGSWDPIGHPTSDDAIAFDLDSDYTVTFSGSASCDSVYVGKDQVTFYIPGTTFSISYGAFIGDNGEEHGRLTVKSGTVQSATIYVGIQNTANGGLTLTDRSVWNSLYEVVVGFSQDATGNLTIEDASRFTCNNLTAGNSGDSIGAISVSGVDSSLISATNITIGSYARGLMTVADGAYVESNEGIIGYSKDFNAAQDPYGLVLLSDSGTQWHIVNDLTVGDDEDSIGSFTVANGAKLDNQDAMLGYDFDSHGSATVIGSRSEWECRGALVVGDRGYAEVNIGGGGLLNTQDTYVGQSSYGQGTMVISGSGSVWNNQNLLNIFSYGNSSVTVKAGAILNNGGNLVVHDVGSLTIDGGTVNTHTLSLLSDPLNIDAGTVSIRGGAYNPGTTTDLIVDSRLVGDLSTLRFLDAATSTIPDELIVGEYNNGALEISGGSSVEGTICEIGKNIDSTGAVTVSGYNSILDCYYSITVGNQGAGRLDVVNCGQVATNTLYIAPEAGGNGALTVTGGANVDISHEMFVGCTSTAGGNGTLTVGDGGSVGITDHLWLREPGTINLDGGTISTGELHINGGTFNFTAGTLNLIYSNLVIENAGLLGRTLTLNSGQAINVDGGLLIVQAEGLLDLRGGGLLSAHTFQNGGEIVLGGLSGTVAADTSVSNSGLIHGSGRIDSQLINNTSGQIRIESGQRIEVTGTGSINNGRIDLVGGTFDCPNQIINDVDGYISGRGQILADGGLINGGIIALSGGFSDIRGDVQNDSVTSKIFVSGGATVTFYDDVHSNGLIHVAAASAVVFFGDFDGSGGTSGTGTVYSEGDLRPGNSPALVSFGGDLVLGGNASLAIELGGIVAGSEHDVIDATGRLSLDGALNVTLIDGFNPLPGQTFDILDFGSIAGGFSQFNLPKLDVYLEWDTSDIYTSGQLAVIQNDPIPGDADYDGTVNNSDAAILAANWQSGPGTVWDQGDFNGDGYVDAADATLLAANWQTSASTTVPEPSAAVLLLCMAISAVTMLRRR